MSTAQPTVTILSNLSNIFNITTGVTQESNQNIEFGAFGQNTGTSNLAL